MREENLKDFSKNKIYYERKKGDGFSFHIYRLTYSEKRFFKKATKLSKKLNLPFFVEGQDSSRELVESFKEILERNLLVFLAEKRKITAAEICDPNGKLCFKIDSAIKNLKTTKITTRRTDLYEDYLDSLLNLYGVCPTLLEREERTLFYRLKSLCGNEIVLGGEGFRADIKSLSLKEAENLCPKENLKEEFFTFFALFGKFAPLLDAVPHRLVLKEIATDVACIF